jgi:transcriptional regulator with XRE-family HTH domain
MNLGESIYKMRTQNSLSQAGLAEALGVSRQSISKWENNSAMPELDKLIRMTELFHVTLDELVFGRSEEEQPKECAPQVTETILKLPSKRVIFGFIFLIFSMIFFLFSVFWGDHLAFGEEFGELASLTILLISIVLIATYNMAALTVCAISYTIYSIIWYRFVEQTSLTNYVFTFVFSIIIFVWFIILGLHANKQK